MKAKNMFRWVLALMILMGFLFPAAAVFAQEGGFTETFDAAPAGWDLSAGASVGGGVLRLESGSHAMFGGEWEDFSVVVRARTEQGGALAISFRSSPSGGYHLLIEQQRLALQRETAEGIGELAAQEGDMPWGGWIEITVRIRGSQIEAGFYDEVVLTSSDPDVLPAGGLGFEVLGEGSAEIDEVRLEVLGEVALPTAGAPAQLPGGAAVPAYQSLPWFFTGGPPGGLGYDIRMDPRDPDVMYVTDAWAGAFKSLDGGATWFPINNGITTRGGMYGAAIPVFSLTIDPNNPDRLWLGTQFMSDVYRSDDGGMNWTLMNDGILEWGLSVRGFTVQQGNSDVVYFAAEISSHEWNHEQPLDCYGLDSTMGVVYKSTDAGGHWERIWRGDNLARYIWIHPQDPNFIYISTGIFDRCAANADHDGTDPGGVGILRSRDGGATWEELGVQQGFAPDDLYIGSLYMHPTNPDILLAAAGNDVFPSPMGHPMGGIYLSEDGGDTWQEVLDGMHFSAVEICEGDPQVAYAGALSGFFRSEDGGHTWTQVAGALWGSDDIVAGFPIDMQCDPRDPMRIFVNNYNGGNFLSEDGGQTWQDASAGYTGAMMTEMALVEEDPARLYVSARGGLFATDDGGQTWRGLGYGLARALEGMAIAVDPYDADHILGTLADAGPFPKISFDAGNTWQGVEPEMLGQGQPGLLISILFAPQTEDLLMGAIGSYDCLTRFGCGDGSGRGIIRSTDGGMTWMQTSLTQGTAVALAAARTDDALWYAYVYPAGLYRSQDYGQTWELVVSHPLPEGLGPSEPMEAGQPPLLSLAVDPVDAERLYAGYYQQGIAVSDDGGRTWSSLTAGLPPEAIVMDIAVDQSNPSIIYSAVTGSGVYCTTDGGQSWSPIGQGLFSPAVEKLALSADGSVLYVSTEGAGVSRLGTPPESGASPPEAPPPEEEASQPPSAQATEEQEGRGLPCLGGLLPLGLVALLWARKQKQ
jgi:photosystem II stability/assembly factor-like uncharacterized protein